MRIFIHIAIIRRKQKTLCTITAMQAPFCNAAFITSLNSYSEVASVMKGFFYAIVTENVAVNTETVKASQTVGKAGELR